MGIFSDILSKNGDFYGQKKATKKHTSQKKITKKKNPDLARIAHQIMFNAPHLYRGKFSTTYPHIHNKERSCSAPRPPGGRVFIAALGYRSKEKRALSCVFRHTSPPSMGGQPPRLKANICFFLIPFSQSGKRWQVKRKRTV